jgi:hypothetical protein
MYKKSLQNYQNALADCFNKKKTKENDINRFNNIHKKFTPIQPFNLPKEQFIDSQVFKQADDIYNLSDVKLSTNITFNFDRKDCTTKIPKIHLKDIMIPIQNEHDIYDFNNVNTPINTNEFIGNEINEEDVNRLKNEHEIYDFNNNNNNINNNNKTPIHMNIFIRDEINDGHVNSRKNNHDIYDFNNNINNNIKTPIHMNIFIRDEFNNGLVNRDEFNNGHVNRLKNKKVTTINHIYQQKYKHDTNVTGFGDFIRGCFYILQFCNKFNFKCEILINHPIAFFLEKFHSSYSYNYLFDKSLSENNEMFIQNNLKDTIFNKNNNNVDGFVLYSKTQIDFVEYLCNLKIINRSIYSYNILFPYDDVSPKECSLMANLLEPTNEMNVYVDETIKHLGITKKKFIIIHVRSGDSYLKNETKIFDSLYFKTITNEIFKIINNNSENIDVLLIADNNEIKYLICKVFPKIKTLYKGITHLGEGAQLEREKVKNTLLDFYLISYSVSVYSFTVYPHGTGFSWWCSKVYGIPYTCKYISNK